MLPVLNSEEIRACDLKTIKEEPIRSIDLMERASLRFVEAFKARFKPVLVVVLCGPGNNGGDGLAIARLLAERGIEVLPYILQRSRYSEDNLVNQQRVKALGIDLVPLQTSIDIPAHAIVVDALFGSGLDRPLSAEFTALVLSVNALSNKVVAVDMPSGMPDRPTFEWSTATCIQAEYVYTFQFPKLSLLLPTASGFASEFEILDIGLIPNEIATDFLLERADIKRLLVKQDKFDHKYKKGHVVLIGGSKGKTGSIVLSCEAALRSTAGLVTAYLPNVALAGLQAYLPEAMYVIGGEEQLETFDMDLAKVNAVGLGPGLGEIDQSLMRKMLDCEAPMVIDADGIRLLAKHSLFQYLPNNTILTPHEGELRALIGHWNDELDKLDKAKAFCLQYEVILLVKGAHTVVTDGTRLFFNPIGHPAMGTAGSGDVLLGIIAAMLSKGILPLHASQLGAYLHAKAGLDYLNENKSASMIASDICLNIGKIIKELEA